MTNQQIRDAMDAGEIQDMKSTIHALTVIIDVQSQDIDRIKKAVNELNRLFKNFSNKEI